MKGRWMNGTFVLDHSVVGTVLQGATGHWFAYGCLDDWEDTRLGAHDSEDDARKAVEDWVQEKVEA